MAMEMVDRLGELGRGRSSPGMDPDPGEMDETEYALEGFFSTVNEIIQNISDIESTLGDISKVQNEIVTRPSSSNQPLKQQHNELMEKVKKLSQKAHRGIKRLDEELKGEEQGPKRHTADHRIKRSQFSALSHRLKAVMLEYNQLEQDHRESVKRLITRQLETAGTRIPEDKVEEMLESEDVQVFAQNILTSVAQRRQVLNEVEERKKEILQLEENIMELHDMFYDMMLLVEDQGDLVDSIEFNVERAANYVQQGAVDTARARVYSQKNTRMKWIICAVLSGAGGCALVIIVIVVIAVAVIVRNQASALTS